MTATGRTPYDTNYARVEAATVQWEPNPGSQMLFISCPYDELLYHGTRGPGKTAALLMDFVQDVGVGWGPSWRGVLFRETYKQLADIVAKTYEFFPRVFPDARFSAADYEWRFPEGETLLLRYMKHPRDYWEYHGHEYPWIAWEELTNWITSECYDSMFSCNRSTRAGIPKRVRSTCNPWGVGHNWVKKYFIDAAPPGKPIVQEFTNPLTGETVRRVRGHIFGSIFENKHLIKNDPQYLANLITIQDENKRKAWLEGRWDIVPGGFFGDVFLRERNVLPAFSPPPEWECFLAFDWGSASPFSLGFYAIADGEKQPVPNRVLPRGALVRFDEWYGADEKTGEGLRLVNDVLGDRIVRRAHNWIRKGLSFSAGVADPSIWIEEGGPSIYEQMKAGMNKAKEKLGIHPARLGTVFDPADNARLPGWQQMRERLYNADEDRSMLYITDNCTEWLRTVPMLPRDEDNWDDVDTDAEDHCFAPGTRVLMPGGEYGIEEIPTSGTVWTAEGWQQYRNARITRRQADVVQVTFEDGRQVTCTPDHRFATTAGEVGAQDLLDETCYTVLPWSHTSKSSLSRSNGFLGSRITFAVDIFNARVSGFIEKCGNIITEKSRPGFTYITETITGRTTRSVISNWFRQASTLASIPSTTTMPEFSALREKRHYARPPSGIAARQDFGGTQTGPNAMPRGLRKMWLKSAARSAASHIPFVGSLLPIPNSAMPTARLVRCVSVEPAGRSDVYCLTVPESGWFTVEGGLVASNCGDESRYACMRVSRRLRVVKLGGL